MMQILFCWNVQNILEMQMENLVWTHTFGAGDNFSCDSRLEWQGDKPCDHFPPYNNIISSAYVVASLQIFLFLKYT